MAGTKIGGMKAARTNKLKHGADFYAVIGGKGGRLGSTGGFAKDVPCTCGIVMGRHYKRNCAGKLGGTISRRTAKKKET